MIAAIIAFAGGAALMLGAAYFMLRTMSMLKAGLALVGSALGAALLLFILHADVVATMAIMMFGPAMLGMILFMLMLMEDSGGFMMTSSSDVPARSAAAGSSNVDVEPEVKRAAAGILGPITEIAVMPGAMDMAMTNDQMRWGGWIALGFFAANAVVVTATPWVRDAGAPSRAQPFLIGTALLDKYMLVFEGCGFLILLAVIVATMVGRRVRT